MTVYQIGSWVGNDYDIGKTPTMAIYLIGTWITDDGVWEITPFSTWNIESERNVEVGENLER